MSSRRMNRIIIVAVFLLSTSCAAKMPANYTPQTKQLYVLTDVVNGIGTLQTTAENTVPQNILPLSTARKIVSFCVSANTVINQYPNGWYQVVNTAYIQLKASLTQSERDNFQYAFDAFEYILNSFVGAQ